MIGKKISFAKILMGLFLLAAALMALLPFFLMAITSLTDKESINFDFSDTEFHIRNYNRIFTSFQMGRIFFNNIVITASSCILNCLVSSMAAFAFAKKKFPGKEKIFLLYLASIIIPAQVTLIPYFLIIRKLNLMNNYFALILPIGGFGTFLIRQFMSNIPDDLLEAAIIDGSSEPNLFIKIVIPLIKSVLITLTIFTFISCWNDFLRPMLVMMKNEMKTLTLIISILNGTYQRNYGLLCAAMTTAFLPSILLYVVLQKQFVEGIALSGIKG
jgi:multiple sugar transport system permease protein